MAFYSLQMTFSLSHLELFKYNMLQLSKTVRPSSDLYCLVVESRTTCLYLLPLNSLAQYLHYVCVFAAREREKDRGREHVCVFALVRQPTQLTAVWHGDSDKQIQYIQYSTECLVLLRWEAGKINNRSLFEINTWDTCNVMKRTSTQWVQSRGTAPSVAAPKLAQLKFLMCFSFC